MSENRSAPSLRSMATLVALLVVAVLLVKSVRSTLFEQERRIENRHDVYFLPPPEQVRLMSLGYRHALADVLWAHVMVSQGLHTFQRRRFENLVRLYDAINELDPTWRTPYLMADALITFQANVTPYEDVLKAREILERGVKHRPYDADIWLNLGQFVSYVAPPSYLEDYPEVAERWRTEGVKYLQRAAELGGSNSDVSWQAIGGANILARAGELEASLRFLQRTYAVTDDEQLKADIKKKIELNMEALAGEEYRLRFQAFERRQQRVDELMRQELPLVKKDLALLLGPPLKPAICAGAAAPASPACATSWRTWSERYQAAEAAPRDASD